MEYGKLGKDQGDMKPVVESYQKPQEIYSQSMMGKTTQYISRHNAQDMKAAGKVRKQNYKGRYE